MPNQKPTIQTSNVGVVVLVRRREIELARAAFPGALVIVDGNALAGVTQIGCLLVSYFLEDTEWERDALAPRLAPNAVVLDVDLSRFALAR